MFSYSAYDSSVVRACSDVELAIVTLGTGMGDVDLDPQPLC